MKPKIFLRLLMKDKEIISELRDNYYGIILDSHILETYPTASANFIEGIRKPFLIDPSLYKFSFIDINIEKLKEKGWFERIFETYGINQIIDDPHDFVDLGILAEGIPEITNAIISYQKERIKEILGGLSLFGLLGKLEPEAILVPYFFIEDIRSDRYKLNLDILSEVIKIGGEKKIFSTIAISKDLLASDRIIKKILLDYNREEIDAFCVWIGDFRETAEDEILLRNYIKFFQELSKLQRPIINLYGGFFSVILSKLGYINTICHGICYGESKDPFSTLSGGGFKRYYVPKLHNLVSLSSSQELCKELPELKCNCDICKKFQIDEIENMSSIELGKHYLITRKREIDEIESIDLSDLNSQLDSIYKTLKKKDLLQIYWGASSHIPKWKKILIKIQ
jgi:hypothetical protein